MTLVVLGIVLLHAIPVLLIGIFPLRPWVKQPQPDTDQDVKAHDCPMVIKQVRSNKNDSHL